ncbi:MAG: hypothetical protein QXS74_06410 [Nitrososphaeria archaeon]
MKIGEIGDYIEKIYFSKRNGRSYGLLFLGPPGIGKSTVIEETAKRIAERLGKQFVKVAMQWENGTFKIQGIELDKLLNNSNDYFVFTDFRLTTIEPSDLTGIPRSRNGITFYDPMVWAVIHSACEGIIFLDEITWIQRDDIFSIAPQIILDKIAGNIKFHPNTLIIAAGNRSEDSSIVRMLHNPLLNRFKIIKVDAPNLEDWNKFMDTHYDNWDKRVLAFLMRFKDEGYFLKLPKDPEGFDNFPTPRTWSWLALDLVEGFDRQEDIIGLVGEEVGRKFMAFMKYNIDINDLIANPEKFDQLEFDAKYMAITMLASWLSSNKKKMEAAFPLIDKLSNEKHEYLVLLCMSMNPKNLQHFIEKLSKHNPKYLETLYDITVRIKHSISV